MTRTLFEMILELLKSTLFLPETSEFGLNAISLFTLLTIFVNYKNVLSVFEKKQMFAACLSPEPVAAVWDGQCRPMKYAALLHPAHS